MKMKSRPTKHVPYLVELIGLVDVILRGAAFVLEQLLVHLQESQYYQETKGKDSSRLKETTADPPGT
jgi:hypothetical protein